MSVTLEQWRALVAVVDQEGYAKAAEFLDKSQSAVSYLIQKLETSLEIRVFAIEGRRSVLTPAGRLLYQKAKQLLQSAEAIELTAAELSSNWQARINLAVDTIFPEELLFSALKEFSEHYPVTRVNVQEAVLSGVGDALIKRQANIAINTYLLPGFVGEPLLTMKFIAVASPNHPLFTKNEAINFSHLRQHRQLVVSDLGSQSMSAGWLDAEQRWTFSHLTTSIQAAVAGLGYAWYPEAKIKHYLEQGLLKPLPLEQGATRFGTLYLIYADNEFASLCCKKLGKTLLAVCKGKSDSL